MLGVFFILPSYLIWDATRRTSVKWCFGGCRYSSVKWFFGGCRYSKSCASVYVIQDGDDCHSISRSQQVSTAEMLYFNNLEAGCTHFPGAGLKLCMPHKCDVYTVKENDTCYGITDSYNNTFTMSQLISWNVDINRGCDNLEMLVGNQICVSFPGDASAPSVTGAPPGQTSSLSFSCFTPGATAVDDR